MAWMTRLMISAEEVYAHRFELGRLDMGFGHTSLLQQLEVMDLADDGPPGVWVARIDADESGAWNSGLTKKGIGDSLRERLVIELGLGQIGDSLSGIRRLRGQLSRAGLCHALRIEAADVGLIEGALSMLTPDNIVLAPDFCKMVVAERDSDLMSSLRAQCATSGITLMALAGPSKRERAWLREEGVHVLGEQPVRWSFPMGYEDVTGAPRSPGSSFRGLGGRTCAGSAAGPAAALGCP